MAGSGKSGKVAIVAGQLTAADSVLLNAALMKVFEKHPDIKVVSNQASNWDPDKAREITSTVLQQNPDLCAVFGHWDVFSLGIGQAVKQAGQTGKVLVFRRRAPVRPQRRDPDPDHHLLRVRHQRDALLLSGCLYAARQNGSGSDTSQSFEVLTLTAVVLGGVAMSGGRGSVGRAIIGAGIMMVLINGLVRNGVPGEVNSLILGAVLLIAVGIDIKWTKNKAKAIQKIYLTPARYGLPACPVVAKDAGTVYQVNTLLEHAEPNWNSLESYWGKGKDLRV